VEPGSGDDGTYTGTMTIKIGPITSRYKGTVKIERADEQARVAVMSAQAKDARGQGTASATITSSMEEVPDGTRVKVETDMRVTGPAAQFGRGVMQDVSAKLMKRFADCLAEQMSGGAAEVEQAAPAQAAPAAAGDGAPEPSTTVTEAGVPGASSGVSSAEAEQAVPSASSGTSTAQSAPPKRPSDDVLDLGEVSREAVLTSALPVVGGVLALLVILRLIRR
jgi:carbon monoxide dehydrogenase subunit G